LRIGAGRCRTYIRIDIFKESIMKALSFLGRTVVATLLVSASVAAFAGVPVPVYAAPQTISATAPSPTLQLAAVDRSVVQPSAPFAGTADVADTASGAGSQAKTRAQVRAELIQAEKAGLIPAGNVRFPAGPETMARNRFDFQSAQSWWTAHGQGPAWGG
jgi:hypothetical protein